MPQWYFRRNSFGERHKVIGFFLALVPKLQFGNRLVFESPDSRMIKTRIQEFAEQLFHRAR